MAVGTVDPPARWGERLIHAALLACAFVSILTTVGIVVVLVVEAAQFFREVSIVEFLTDTKWTPLFRPQHFGILPLFCGTMLVSIGAIIVALPIGLGTAIYLSEYASNPVREVVKPILEILAGIPSVVFGFLAVVLISPMIREVFPSANVFNAASASVVVGFMILPMIVSLSEDVLRSVPLVAPRGGLRVGRDEIGRDGEGRAAGGDFGHRGVVPAGHFAGDRRDDGRGAGGGRVAQDDAQSAREHPNDDGLHRAGQPGRHAGRLAGISHDLRRWPRAVCGDDDAEHSRAVVRVADAGEIRMSLIESNAYRRRKAFMSQAFAVLCLLATVFCVLVLVVLLASIFYRGFPWLTWSFVTSYPSRFPAKAGILPALVSSIWLIGLTTLFSVPIGVGAAVYLEEYAKASRWRNLVQLNISNLAGVPSIVYGILGLGLFVRALMLQRSILAGALTLTLVVLPIIILAAQEALRAVPDSIRRASYALGATRWQTVRYQVLPASLPGIMTGVILAISRALGEAAPLVAIGAATFITFVPKSPWDEFSGLPVQIFDWASRPQAEFRDVAGAGIIVLLTLLIVMNAGAVFVRYRYGQRIRW